MGDDDLVGQILLGKLEVLRKIGGGGMGEVYEVEHRLTGHRRALKVVQAQYADRPRFMKRLLREAKVAGTLATEHVVETYDAGRLESGAAYVLMELLEGETLYEAFQRENRIAPRRLAGIMAQVAEGMVVAHAAGIVHRDLKPENVFLLSGLGGERVKILDFGVSKFEQRLDEPPSRLTAEGTLVGTPYYMSPEQASGKAVDARTDIYAMGVMIYECLSGRLPFEAASVGELFVKIAAGQCVPLDARVPDLDPRWSALAHRAFDRRPEARFEDAESLRRALLPLLEGGTTGARAKTISDSPRSTLAYDQPLPAPPAFPREAATLASLGSEPPAVEAEPELPQEDLSGDHELEALGPPPATGAGTGRPWAWALAGVALLLALVVPYVAMRDPSPGPAESPTVASPPPSAPDPEESAPTIPTEPSPTGPIRTGPSPTLAPPPVVAVATEGRDAGLGASVIEGASEGTPVGSTAGRGRRRGSAAESAGLDPNPYH